MKEFNIDQSRLDEIFQRLHDKARDEGVDLPETEVGETLDEVIENLTQLLKAFGMRIPDPNSSDDFARLCESMQSGMANHSKRKLTEMYFRAILREDNFEAFGIAHVLHVRRMLDE